MLDTTCYQTKLAYYTESLIARVCSYDGSGKRDKEVNRKMQRSLHIIMPMAGEGSRFLKEKV